MSDYSVEFFQSLYDTKLKKEVVEVLEKTDMGDDEKIEYLLNYIKGKNAQ